MKYQHGVLDNVFPMTGKAIIDPEDDSSNGWVQDWLVAWAKKFTVYGSNDWEAEAKRRVATRREWADKWRVTETKLVREAMLFESVIELIQETYSNAEPTD